jgi:cytochrome P450
LPTRTNRRRKQIAAEVDGILKGLIAKREEDLRTGQLTTDDLLGLLMESNMAHCRGQGDGGGLTTDEVIGECKLFYFAGTETTSALLTWTMVLLCMHPEWQHRAREEVLQVLGTSSTPDYDDLSRLRTVSSLLVTSSISY